MAAPENREQVNPYNPPKWMREGAVKAVAQMTPEQIAARLRSAPEDVKKNQDAAVRALKKVKQTHDWPKATAPRAVQQSQMQERAARVEDTKQRQEQFEQAKNPNQIQNRDKRRAKKTIIKKDQTVVQKKRKSSSTPSPTYTKSSASMAELLTTQREVFPSSNPRGNSSSTSLFVPERQNGYRVSEFPSWYTAIGQFSSGMRGVSLSRPPALRDLDAIKISITKCEEQESPSLGLYSTLRAAIHKADVDTVLVTNKADKYIICHSRILSPAAGLPRVFKAGANFPADIKADAYALYIRWINMDFDHDLLRGIVTKKGPKRNGDSLDPKRIAWHNRTSKYFGQGYLVVGQWWPSQLSTLRDAAHGATQGGIFGEPENGAYSIVLSGGNSHDDTDEGDVITYCGTAAKPDAKGPTDATASMIMSVSTGQPIRVLRSSQLESKNEYRPKVGIRYDGLYVATGYELTKKETHEYRFKLERCPEQDPIRYNGAETRPTFEEHRAFHELKRMWR